MPDKRIDKRLADYDTNFLMCRYRRHLWNHAGFYRARHDNGRFIVSVLECSSCGTQREDWIAPTNGTLVLRQYRHPKGFLFAYTDDERAAGVRARMADVSRALIKRSTVYDDAATFRLAEEGG